MTQPPRGVLTTDPLGIWVPAMTDDPAWEADWLFGVYHHTPVQPWIAALFIADAGAAT